MTTYGPNSKSGGLSQLRPLLERYRSSLIWYSIHSERNIEHPNWFESLGIPFRGGKYLRYSLPFLPKQIREFLRITLGAWLLSLDITTFARQNRVNIVFADLSSESIVAAYFVAQWLRVPLIVNVQDDPIATAKYRTRSKVLVKVYTWALKRTLRLARGIGVISQYLLEYYEENNYSMNHISVLYAGVEQEQCLPTPQLELNKETITIGSVGTIKSRDAWVVLQQAVDILNQQYQSKTFQILHIGKMSPNLHGKYIQCIEWVEESILKQYIEQFDLCFVSYWFDKHTVDLARTSLPTKITSYIQSQRPIIALGPSYSSIVRFVESNKSGVVCTELDANLLAASIADLLFIEGRYEQATIAMGQLKQVYSREQYFLSFDRLIEEANSL